jgi:hypothetical protein
MTTAMQAAFTAQGIHTSATDPGNPASAEPKPKHKKCRSGKRRWSTSSAEQRAAITWSHDVGTMAFSVKDSRVGHVSHKRGYYWAQIYHRESEPEVIEVEITHNLKEGVVPFYSQDGNMIDGGSCPIPSLKVPVRWNNGVPHTRVRGKDNADLVLRLENGEFIDLQVAVLTRGGDSFLSIQELSSGQICKLADESEELEELKGGEVFGYKVVTTNDAENGMEHFIILPFLSEHAYPGADFAKVQPNMAQKLVEFSARDATFRKLEDGEVLDLIDWDPPAFPTVPGLPMGAVMTWFNPIVGGKALCADGVECFIPLVKIPDQHYRSMMKQGGFPVLLPRQQLMLCYQDVPGKGRAATEILPIEVPESDDE